MYEEVCVYVSMYVGGGLHVYMYEGGMCVCMRRCVCMYLCMYVGGLHVYMYEGVCVYV